MATATLLTPRAARLPLRVEATFTSGGTRTSVILVNVTHHGFMAVGGSGFFPGQHGILLVEGEERLEAEVRWVAGDRFGARFLPSIRTFTLGRILARQSA